MKDYYVRQCILIKKDGDATHQMVSWIPEKYAKIGKILKLKDDNEWSNGWVVESVSSERRSSKEQREKSRGYKHHRKITDI